MSVRAYVAMGSNLADRQALLDAAVERLRQVHGLEVVAVAPAVETEAQLPPEDPTPQPRYLNSAVAVDCAFGPEELLATLKRLEVRLGRTDTRRWAPRPIDLDLVLFGDAVRTATAPLLPHPAMHTRRFVLEPLAALAPDARHPVLGQTVAELLAALDLQPPGR